MTERFLTRLVSIGPAHSVIPLVQITASHNCKKYVLQVTGSVPLNQCFSTFVNPRVSKTVFEDISGVTAITSKHLTFLLTETRSAKNS